jgi:uncharacterized LabA/DUF88 family protein
MIAKTLVLIDGENLVFRYQEMVKAGRKPKAEIVHIPDVFVWHKSILDNLVINVSRAIYYTSAQGDDNYLDSISRQIQKVNYKVRDISYTMSGRLVPRVFKKSNKSTKSRHVDIQITLDALVSACTHDVADFYIISGDSDFIPVIEQLIRFGKVVKVGALSSGLYSRLDLVPDDFEILDDDFFEPMPTA